MIVVDLQGFTIKKQFIPKELALYDGYRQGHYIFKPPCEKCELNVSERKTVNWLERHYHGLLWDSGFTYLNQLYDILIETLQHHEIVYVKGEMKLKFLKELTHLDNIYAYPEDKQPSLRKFISRPECMFHVKKYTHCALSNVLLLYKYIQ